MVINNLKLLRYTTVFTIMLTLFSSLAWADSVEIKTNNRQSIVGENIYFAVVVEIDDEKIIDVSAVRYNGTPLRYEERSQSSSSYTMVINGRTVRQSSDLTKSYIFELPTSQVGTISLPAYTIKIGDKEYQTDPVSFEVLPKPTSSNLLFVTEISNGQDSYYPTQLIELNCKIYYRNFPGSPSIEDIALPIINHRGFTYLPADNPNTKLLVNDQEFMVFASHSKEIKAEKEYNFFNFKLKFRLMEPGEFTFANNLKMKVQTGQVYRQRGFLGSQLVRQTKSIYADSTPLTINVRQLPQDNVPPSFNGAIGNFKIKVIPSSDTDIKVGDPITLSITISGRGTWEFVKSPPIHKIRAITDYFKVSEDLIAGEVSADQTSKTFRVRLRVKSKMVKRIPAIPFTYFDLLALKYVTIHSDPIPISVFDATSKVQVVDFAKKLARQQDNDKKGLKTDKNKKPGKLPTEPGQRQEYQAKAPELIKIADNVEGELLSEDHAPHYIMVIYAFCPLTLVFLLLLSNLYRQRNKSDSTIAKEKAKKAYKQFLTHSDHLGKEEMKSAEFCRHLGQNIQQFLANRFMLTIVELDQSFFDNQVADGKISRPLADDLLAIMETIDQHRYTNSTLDQSEVIDILAKAKEVLRQC